jgi:hypothetical protein
MAQEKLEKILFEAFLHAAKRMGPRVKGMSCFLKNWRDTNAVSSTRHDIRDAA